MGCEMDGCEVFFLSIGRLNFGLWWFLVTMEPGGI